MVHPWGYVDYAIPLELDASGNWMGMGASRQLDSCEYPGLMGFAPRLQVLADRIVLSASLVERRPGRWLDVVFFFIPFANAARVLAKHPHMELLMSRSVLRPVRGSRSHQASRGALCDGSPWAQAWYGTKRAGSISLRRGSKPGSCLPVRQRGNLGWLLCE